MSTPIILPDLGAAPVSVSVWFADVGDLVWEGERLVEVLTEAATFDVVSPSTGRLLEKKAYPRDQVLPGQVLGTVDATADADNSRAANDTMRL
jgi:pyruvate/2-oxoglutarate dehydrogenase complex dihydrolipoamide acyltransferase (E2) component